MPSDVANCSDAMLSKPSAVAFGGRIGAAAEGGSTEADGIGRLTCRRRISAFHVGAGALSSPSLALKKWSVLSAVLYFGQLLEVHRIGVLGACGDMGDLAFFGETVDVGPAPTETVLARSATEPVPIATLLSANANA